LTSSDQEISVHQIFGRNLRELCKRTGTIAEVADHLGVNRVQMNRILNGESFPKRGLMKRICDHFSVNARILLEPLAELEAKNGIKAQVMYAVCRGHLMMHFLVAITRLMRKT